MIASHIPLITYPAIFVAVFARQLGLPVPAVISLMMAGVLGAAGKLSIPGIIATAIIGSLMADLLWFQAGRRWGSRIVRLLCSFSSDRRYCARKTKDIFARWGLQILMIAKFVPGLDGLLPPLSGLEGAGTIEFAFFDGIGALLWVSAYCSAGYFFANGVDAIAAALDRVSGTLIVVLIIPFLAYLVWKAVEFTQMVSELRLRVVFPEVLQERLNAGKKIAVLDLLLYEGESVGDAESGIPGAIRIDPAELRRSPRVHVPDDVYIVLYCSSAKEMTSVRVAISLRRRGIRNVWVLRGGLKAWKNLNLPVTTELGNAEDTATRFGITVMTRPLSRYTDRSLRH